MTKLLTLKLTILLALAAVQRGSEIRDLDIRYMSRFADKYVFTLGGTTPPSPPPRKYRKNFFNLILQHPVRTLHIVRHYIFVVNALSPLVF